MLAVCSHYFLVLIVSYLILGLGFRLREQLCNIPPHTKYRNEEAVVGGAKMETFLDGIVPEEVVHTSLLVILKSCNCIPAIWTVLE